MKTQIAAIASGLALLTVGVKAQPAQPPPSPLVPPANAPFAPAVPEMNNPRVQFDSLIHDFGRISAGASVRHDFIFTNIGLGTLKISNVITSCGCTTAGQWSRDVEPGQIGTIPIQFNSGNAGGLIFKTVTVQSNDKQQPNVTLQIKGEIWRPVEVNPTFAVLQANTETVSQARSVVKIVNREESPLTLNSVECSNQAFVLTLRTNQPGREYELQVTAAGTAPAGNSQGVISLKTSSSNAPVVNVTAMLVLQPTVTIMPPQIHLAAAPLPSAQTVTISVMNNGTNTLTLSDPLFSGTNVAVQLRETAPGRYFNLSLTFPVGFELAQGQPAELTVKTSHPQYPILKVPVMQAVRRVMSSPVSPPQPTVVPARPTPVRPIARPPVPAKPRPLPLAPPPLPGT